MTKKRRTTLGASTLVLTAGWFAPGAGQGRQETVVQLADSIALTPEPGFARALVLEREVFLYPILQRRNPFLPQDVHVAEGPSFQELRLLGIIHHPDARYSVVVLGIGDLAIGGLTASAPAQLPGMETFRLRLGDVLGTTRILEIHEDRVVVEVDETSGPSRRVLKVPRAVERELS